MQHCLLHSPCHTQWKGHSMPPSKRNSFSFERKFYIFEEDLLGEFHAKCLSCAQNLTSLQRWKDAAFIKERCCHSIHDFGAEVNRSWLMRSFLQRFVTVKYCQTLCASAISLSGCSRSASLNFFSFDPQHRPVLEIRPNIHKKYQNAIHKLRTRTSSTIE